ncbi:MAG: NAD(P)-dependent oxidoreductase [Gammaproteobacteria bacterium]|nr:NAD(P)-dependent oxidoreductase [Gammaproteobacteria bacterium]
MGKRILFTGGSGKAGRHVIPYLVAKGHKLVNLDLHPLGYEGVLDLKTDLCDSGQVFNAFTGYAGFEELETGNGVEPYDAVVHFAAVARILLAPDNEVFRINTQSTYNVIEAAVKLGIKKVIIASSETTYGVCFADGTVNPSGIPVREDCLTNPPDSYALSKVVGEQTARSFHRRSGIDIYALRIGNVIEPHEYDLFPGFAANPLSRRRNFFSHIDARDLGQIVNLCLHKDGLGYQVFNATNTDNSIDIPAKQLAEQYFPGTPQSEFTHDTEALLSNRKIREVLGFVDEHDWRQYV